MEIKSQRKTWLDNQKAKTRERVLRVVTDYNGGIHPKEIAKREGISVPWVYKLIEKAKTEVIN